mgnify:CR=1 FL=1
MGNTNTSSIFGETHNPWSSIGNEDLIVVGASVASVASYTCYAGIGSDTAS